MPRPSKSRPSAGAATGNGKAAAKSISEKLLPRLEAAQKLTANLNAAIAASKARS
jgi:hypothetical protein